MTFELLAVMAGRFNTPLSVRLVTERLATAPVKLAAFRLVKPVPLPLNVPFKFTPVSVFVTTAARQLQALN